MECAQTKYITPHPVTPKLQEKNIINIVVVFLINGLYNSFFNWNRVQQRNILLCLVYDGAMLYPFYHYVWWD